MNLIDTHAHIYADEILPKISEFLERWVKSGVEKVFMPNIDSTSIESMLKIEIDHSNCFSMMGLHPCYVKENFKEELKIVNSWLEKRAFCAVGEIGIDLYWDKTFVEEQIKAFEYQIELAKDHNIPIAIHSRDSLEITIEKVKEHQNGNLSGVFHCFTGNEEDAKRIEDLGFHMGIGGVITYKNSGLSEVVKNININNIVLETDSPYLPPTPHRGKTNEPSYLIFICEKVGESMGLTTEEVAIATTENANKLFNQTPKMPD